MSTDLLSRARSLLPTLGFDVQPPAPAEPGRPEMLDCSDPSTGMHYVFSVAPGPMLLAATVLRAPDVPDDERPLVAARLQARMPHARVHLRDGPGDATLALLDAAYAVDADEPDVAPDVLRRLVDALAHAARAIALLEPVIEESEAMLSGFSAGDARRQEALKAVLDHAGVGPLEEAHALGAPMYVVGGGDDGAAPTRVFVRDQTLLFHAAIPSQLPRAALADVASHVHRSVPFGRVLLGPADAGFVLVEYPHLLGDGLTDFDVLHGFAALAAVGGACLSALNVLEDDEGGAPDEDVEPPGA